MEGLKHESIDVPETGKARDAARLDYDRARAEQTRVLYRNCPLGVSGAAGVAFFIAIAIGHHDDPSRGHVAAIWASLVALCAVGHIALTRIYWRSKPADSVWRPWLAGFTLMAFVEGVVWSLGVIWLIPPGDFQIATVLVLSWLGICSAGAIVFGPYPPTYVAFFYPAMSPHVWLALRDRYPMWELIVTLEVTYMIVLPLLARQYSQQLIDSTLLRFSNADLADDLRVQKERAEQANRDKSTFLAATSHDLRQPIHALGLFVGALNNERLSRAARRLVAQIDQSVAAMDELFAALLEISKLDAGTVSVDIKAVAIGPLLERLVREFASEASAKGIIVRGIPTALAVRSDPVLLERIIRNLLTNAVRYTQAGKVLIGARRTSEHVTIAVYDTGIGIPTHLHETIFQEFFQVNNPERDRSRGLGLGLAIVKRLTDLLGARLQVTSQPGAGSCFAVTMPRIAESEVAAAASFESEVQPVAGALIAVIDDEIAIQQGMERLLIGWGHKTLTAGSAHDLLDQNPDTPAPDLIVCDYRLRGGVTGAEAIRQLRQHFARTIPAVLITGDTAPDRIAEAQASGFLLLHKPVQASKLRTVLGHLLRG